MNLKDYLRSEGLSAAAFARNIKAHAPDVLRWANGQRVPPVVWCVKIEVETGGRVSRRDLRPDDFVQIWPELAEAV